MARYEPVQLAFNSVDPEGCSKDKAPIIFVHGLTASKELWNDLPEITAKATNRKVYAVDSRNHGDSPWCDVFNFDCNVDDLLHFMDSINAPKAIIIGHSMGGITGMKLALRAPERVEKLVVEDMSCRKLSQPMLDMVFLYISLGRAALEQVPSDVDEDTARKIIFDTVMQSLPQELKMLARPDNTNFRIQLKRTPEGRWAFKSNVDLLMKALKNSNELMSEPTGVYEGPSCFIYGKLSPFLVGLDEPNIRKHFPNAKMVGIDNATHSVHTECPREFNDALLNFLQE
ncbi:protein ABHD11-like [Argiope bruennichi]|uniref:sn-1-specific diacylglycerol lipase ABHD11 n=1 Tax=Argiope bruennichi TaxID=94029 RepID=A0A8T0EA20_ARGBR|nr:protein ABHD11-like [Argiope bruennichi]KAF8768170.1 Protein ABHD11 like protein [Argiope bruennichi]